MKSIFFFVAHFTLYCFSAKTFAQPDIHLFSDQIGGDETGKLQDTFCINSTIAQGGIEVHYGQNYSWTTMQCQWTGFNANIVPNSATNYLTISYYILAVGSHHLTCTVYALNNTTNKVDTAVLKINTVGIDCIPTVPRFNISDTIICAGDCIEYQNQSTAIDISLIKNYWTFEGGVPNTDYTYNKVNPQKVCYPNAGRYKTKLLVRPSLIARDGNSYRDSLTRYITVLAPPTHTLPQLQSKAVTYPDTLHLHTCMPNARHIRWQPTAGLSCSNCPNPVLSPPYQTAYQCIAWDNEGCEDTCTYHIDIDYGKKQVYIPNAFTPNNDGKNDIFSVFGGVSVLNIKNMQIFDRWGEPVFRTQNIAPAQGLLPAFAGWDGTFRNQAAISDVYLYLIEVEFADGTTEIFKGDVTLLR